MNVNQICCDDHFSKYTNTKSSCCIPETNIMLHVNYISIKTYFVNKIKIIKQYFKNMSKITNACN